MDNLNKLLDYLPYSSAWGGQKNRLYGGIEERQPYASENAFFRSSPHVGGMAAEDNKVVLNPFSTLNAEEMEAIRANESARAYMHKNNVQPTFDLTPSQQQAFAGYSPNILDQRSTIAARILSGDPSAKDITPEQQAFATLLRAMMINRSSK